jgi:hypothetical protein
LVRVSVRTALFVAVTAGLIASVRVAVMPTPRVVPQFGTLPRTVHRAPQSAFSRRTIDTRQSSIGNEIAAKAAKSAKTDFRNCKPTPSRPESYRRVSRRATGHW